MAGPAYTPISSNPFVDVAGTAEAAFNSPTARSYGLGYLQRFREEHLSSLRPLSEFFDRNRLSFTANMSSVMSRINYNLPYFQGNYSVIVLLIAAYSLITNLTLIFSTLFVLGGFFVLSRIPPEGITIGSTSLSVSQLRFGLSILAVLLFFISSTMGTVFWIVGASAVIILGHASLMQEGVEGEFVDTV